MMRNIKLSFPNDVNYSDEIKFEQFSKLASPEMVAIEHAFENKSDLTKPLKDKKESFAYRKLPCNTVCCSKNKKTENN